MIATRSLLPWLLLVVLGVLVRPARAQQETFPYEPDAFLKAFADHLDGTKRPDLEAAAKRLEALYAEGSLTPFMADRMVEAAGTMVERRMGPEGYLLPFAESAAALAGYGHGEDAFARWAGVVDTLLAGTKSPNNKPLRVFLDFSVGFYRDNVLASSRARTWAVEAEGHQLLVVDGHPRVFFPLAELMGIVTGDTLVVRRARGTYHPEDERWVGTQGRIDWTRAGLPGGDVYADFRDHSIHLGGSDLAIDSAWLTYRPMLDRPLQGRLVDKLQVNQTPEDADYPRFRSYTTDASHLELYPNVRYIGSFGLKGYRFQGFGGEEPARLEFYDQTDRLAVRAVTRESFIDDRDRIYAELAAVTIYFGQDSIHHPGVKLRFDQATGDLTLSREETGATSAPFYSSYHQLEANPRQIRWNLNDTVLLMEPRPGMGRKEADFRSLNLFDDALFYRIQGVVSYHPLVILQRYVGQTGGRRDFATLEVAQQFNRSLTVDGVQSLLYQLMAEGFIHYDKASETVTVLDKTLNFVLSKAGRIDYDAIDMHSEVPDGTPNARLDIRDGALRLNGVFEVNLSDSQYVRIFPRGKTLRVRGNRTLDFGGTVFGGSADFYGEDFTFLYDSFAIRMRGIDSMVLYTPTGEFDPEGNPVLAPVATAVSGLSGTLYIDRPDNKSGREDYPDFPYFETSIGDEPGYAHYEKPGIQGGAYDQERFYFEIDDFQIDSLDQVTEAQVGFTGTLKSDGIFPDLRESLTLMPDRSLGFATETPPGGLPLYGGAGTYHDEIRLSNSGLQGGGRIEYLTTVLESNRFTFFPDSTTGRVQSVTVARRDDGVPFPEVANAGVDMTWKPKADSLTLRMVSSPFTFFAGIGTLNGDLTVTPAGLKANGRFDWDEARAVSGAFTFGAMTLASDSARFVIKSPEEGRAALDLADANVRVDFEARTANFGSNDAGSYTELPFNRFLTTVNRFSWDMDAGLIDFESEGRDASWFRSLNPRQDSLRFLAASGRYDMADHVLRLEGVPHIAVGDAHVIPAGGSVTVERDAVVRTLDSARIVFDSLYAWHEIYPARVNVLGRYLMKARGYYRYTDRNDVVQPIWFDDITTVPRITDEGDTIHETVARGVIPDSLPFYLDPKVLYKGPVTLRSSSEKVAFDGYAKLNISDTTYRTGWFGMKDAIESDDFLINIDTATGPRGDTAYVGLYRLFGDTRIYPAVLAPKRRSKDREVMRIRGFVSYREEDKVFVFGDPDKAEGFATRGALFEFADETGHIRADGPLRLGLDLPLGGVRAAAITEHAPEDTVWTFRGTLALKTFLPEDILAAFGTLFYEYNLDAEWLDYYGPESVFLGTFPQVASPKAEEKIMLGISTLSEFSRTKEYDVDLTLTELELAWNEGSESWRTTGAPAGVCHIGDQTVNQRAVVAAEFAPRAAGDYWHLYLETDLDDWFYFYYNRNVLKVISSLDEFNELILTADPKDLTIKHPEGDQFSAVTTATVAERNRFLSKMGFFDGEE